MLNSRGHKLNDEYLAFKIENEKELFALLRKYPRLKNKPVKVWIKNIKPKLSEQEAKKILVYEEFSKKTP